MTQQHNSRVTFPGFTLTGTKDTADYEVETGTITSGGVIFALEFIRNKQSKYPNFLIATVNDVSGKKLWSFAGSGFNGFALLAHTNDGDVIAFVGCGSGKVEQILLLDRLVSGANMDVRRKIHLKRAAGAFLDRGVVLTDGEQKLVEVFAKRESARQAAEEADQEAARQAAREERVRKMLARGYITGYTADGKLRDGIPVLENEWPSVSGSTPVILVSSIDETTGKIGDYLEWFKVIKGHGRAPEKGSLVIVTKERPERKAATTSVLLPANTALIETADGVFEVRLFPSMEAIRQAKAGGLNGGTYVAIENRLPNAKIQVFSVHHDRIDTLGNYETL